MTWETIRLKREDLYEQVWSRPMTEVAKQYRMSDVGLAKICKKLNIPVPSRGYWARKAAGRVPPRAKLSSLARGEQSEVVISRRELPPPDPQQETEAERLVAFEKAPENRIAVDSAFDAIHPLVARTEKSLRSARPDETGCVRPRAKDCLDVRVGPASIDRAVRILNALVKALEARGYPATGDGNGLSNRVTVLGVELDVALEESVDRKVRELTKAEKKEQEKHPWLYRTPRYDYSPAGNFSLRIKGSGNGERRVWSDAKRQRVEDSLNAFIAGLAHAAVRQRAAELERDRYRHEREESERRRREEERHRRLEEARARALETQIAGWRKSGEIRAYVEAVRRTAIERQGAIEPNGNLDRWLTWTSRYADWLDPLLKDVATFRLLQHEDLDHPFGWN